MEKDKSTLEMKVVRDWLRSQVSLIQRDPHLPIASKCISMRIWKWDKRYHSAIIEIRDVTKPLTYYNSEYCRYIRVDTQGFYWKWTIWKELNSVVISIEHPDRSSLPL